MAGVVVNDTSASVLGLLLEGSGTGGELFVRAEQKLWPFWSVTRSQVYRELLLLAERGCVVPLVKGKRKSQPYTITPLGEATFVGWMRADSSRDNLRVPMALHAYFADKMDDGETTAFFAAELADRELILSQLLERRRDAGLPGSSAQGKALGFSIRYQRMAIAWLRDVEGLVE